MAKLAINGGDKACDHAWPTWPIWDDAERQGLMGVLESGKWWYGQRVREFEAAFAAFQDARYGVTTSSGTTSLEVALRALGVGPGDEVIVPAYTFVATASAVVWVGARPVFADICPRSLCINAADVAHKITSRTRAIVPVHLAGHVADMDALRDLARGNDLALLEDACHSWGSKWNGKGTGGIGDCGVFSFQASKNITSAEGGIILTDDAALADRCRSLTNCGRLKTSKWYEHNVVGSNLRLTEFQAALLLAQLGRVEQHMAIRRRNVLLLNDMLRDIPGITVFDDDPRITRRAYHLYCFQVEEKTLGLSRRRFLEALNAEGVPATSGYLTPVYGNPMFQPAHQGAAESIGEGRPGRGGPLDYSATHCPVAELVCREVCWLNHVMLLADEPVIRAAGAAIRKVCQQRDELQRPAVSVQVRSARSSRGKSALVTPD